MKKNTGIGFPNTVSNKNIIIVSDEDYVSQSLVGLINTTKGELLGDPEFGSNILLYLFEINEEALIDLIANDIYESVMRYVPQIIISRNDITGSIYEDTLRLIVRYSYNNSNGTSTIYINLQGGNE